MKIEDVPDADSKECMQLGEIYLESGAIVVCGSLADFRSRNRVQRDSTR